MSPDLTNNWSCADNARTTFPKENMFTATCSCESVFLKGLSDCGFTDSETCSLGEGKVQWTTHEGHIKNSVSKLRIL